MNNTHAHTPIPRGFTSASSAAHQDAPPVDGPALRASLIASGSLRPIGTYTPRAAPVVEHGPCLSLEGPSAPLPGRAWLEEPPPSIYYPPGRPEEAA